MDSKPVCTTPKGICKNPIGEDQIFTDILNVRHKGAAHFNELDWQSINQHKTAAQEVGWQLVCDMRTKEIGDLGKSFEQINSSLELGTDDFSRMYRCSSAKERAREMVVNKTVLRAVRRFYLNLFKNQNCKIVKRRYTNVHSDEFVAALQEIVCSFVLEGTRSDLSSEGSSFKNSKYCFSLSDLVHNNDLSLDLAIFLLRFIGLKSKDNIKYSESIEFKGELVQSSMYSYSNAKLIKLLGIMEFKILYQYAYYFHLDSIFESDSCLSSNSEEYLTAFNKLNNFILTDSYQK